MIWFGLLVAFSPVLLLLAFGLAQTMAGEDE